MQTERKISVLFRDFIDKEYSKLVYYVRSRINEARYHESAEDIVQDVALSIYSKLDVTRPIDNLAGYFYRSLHNRIVDLNRKKVVNTSLENYTYEESGENAILQKYAEEYYDEPTIDEMVEADTALMAAIDQLPREFREVLIAIEFEGLSYEELSKKTKTPIGTLLSRKHRAITQLSKILTNNE